MTKLCFDFGHGGKDSGASYKGRKESDDAFSLGKAVAEEVRRHGIIVDETRISDITVSLGERSGFENKNNYDYFVSFHRNAFKPEVGKGAETYTYLNGGAKATSLARRMQASFVAVGFVDRGVKKANFHVLKETRAPAVLVEIGFIDNTKDNELFDSKRSEIIKGLTKAILAEVGVAYVEPEKVVLESNPKILYRVMAGSYSVRENADRKVKRLKSAGFDATIMKFNQ